jgi:hypothetical protein
MLNKLSAFRASYRFGDFTFRLEKGGRPVEWAKPRFCCYEAGNIIDPYLARQSDRSAERKRNAA